MIRSTLAVSLLSATALACWISPASAQSSDASIANGDIVVTARRVQESLQDVPISITAISGETLRETNVTEVADVTDIAPNVNIEQGIGSIGFVSSFIRGIGMAENQMSIDPPVGIYIDGVYTGRNNSANFKLVELERIEVLRGPQGTTFGRNTTGGAINMVTRKPSLDLGAEQTVGYGRFNRWYTRTRLDTGEIGNTGLRATVAYEHRESDGYVDNPLTSGSGDPGAVNSEAVWAKVYGEWGDLTASYTFDYNDLRGYPPVFIFEYASADVMKFFGSGSAALGGNSLEIRPGRRMAYELAPVDRQAVKMYGHALTLEYRVSDVLSVKSISAIRDFRSFLPGGYGPPGLRGAILVGGVPMVTDYRILTAEKNGRQEQFSQELQAYGTVGDFSYIAGLYYYEEEGEDNNTSHLAFVFPGGSAAVISDSSTMFHFDNDSRAAYAEVTYRPSALNEKLEIAFGGRVTRDHKRIDQTARELRADDEIFKSTTYNATLTYHWTPNFMTYLRHGTGYRSGGFNTRAPIGGNVPFTYEPEKATVYEAGFKADLIDRTLRVNGAIFRTDYKDLQVSQYTADSTGSSGFNLNANARFQGFELELQMRPARGLTFDASVGYVDPQYKRIFFPSPDTGELMNYASIAKFSYVSDWTLHAGGRYEHPVGDDARLIFRLDYSMQSERTFSTTNLANLNPRADLVVQPTYGLLNGRISLADLPLGGLTGEVSVWGRNLTDTKYRVAGIDFGSLNYAGGIYGEPRTYGIELKAGF